MILAPLSLTRTLIDDKTLQELPPWIEFPGHHRNSVRENGRTKKEKETQVEGVRIKVNDF